MLDKLIQLGVVVLWAAILGFVVVSPMFASGPQPAHVVEVPCGFHGFFSSCPSKLLSSINECTMTHYRDANAWELDSINYRIFF